MIRDSARELAIAFDLEYWREHDKNKQVPLGLHQRLRRGRLAGRDDPRGVRRHGARPDRGRRRCCRRSPHRAAASGASAIHFYIFPPGPIIRHGSEEMKQQVSSRPRDQGKMLMCFGVTEPTAGVDTSRITTKAEKVDGGWVINGQKVWITNAQNAQPDPAARPHLAARRRAAVGRHDAVLHRPRPQARSRSRPIEKLGRNCHRHQRAVHRQPRSPRRRRRRRSRARASTTCSTASTPSASSSAFEQIGLGRAALELAVEYANDAHRVRPPDRQEPGRRASAGGLLDPPARRRAGGHGGGAAVRRAASRADPRPTPRSIWPPKPASRPATGRCRRSAASATPRSTTSSAVARVAAAEDRAGLAGDGAQLHLAEGAWPAEVLLSRCRKLYAGTTS